MPGLLLSPKEGSHLESSQTGKKHSELFQRRRNLRNPKEIKQTETRSPFLPEKERCKIYTCRVLVSILCIRTNINSGRFIRRHAHTDLENSVVV